MSNDKMCLLPWISLEAGALGEARPCCLYTTPIGDFNESSLEEIWHSEELDNIRNYFLEKNDFPPGCSRCKNAELAGNKSKRMNDAERFSHHKNKPYEPLSTPVYLDLKFGTVCNLKCRTCSSKSSYKWVDDEVKFYGRVVNPAAKNYWIDDGKPLWTDLETMLPTVEFFDFTGGEPLLIKRHFELLKKAVQLGHAKNIQIHYNTNGTVDLPTEIFDVWKEFKSVELMFSIDGVGAKFDYMRHPGKWEDFMRNLNLARSFDFLHVGLCHTISGYNIYYVDELLEWARSEQFEEYQVYLNILHHPLWQSANRLPPEVKDAVKSKLSGNAILEPIVNFMYTDTENNIGQFVKYIKGIDAIRNENFSEVFPEYYALLAPYFNRAA